MVNEIQNIRDDKIFNFKASSRGLVVKAEDS
jgi:hypothetical protein